MFILYHYYSITVTYSSPSSSFLNPRRSMFPFRNTSRSKFLSDRVGLRTSPPTLNRRSTAAELGRGVLYLMNTSIHACLCSLGNRTWLRRVLFFAHCHSFIQDLGEDLTQLLPTSVSVVVKKPQEICVLRQLLRYGR